MLPTEEEVERSDVAEKREQLGDAMLSPRT